MKSKGILFGLNYSQCKNINTLNGCINDVRDMRDYLVEKHNIPCDVYTDDNVDSKDNYSTTREGMLKRLSELALLSHTESLNLAFIHFSGHGSYVRDRSFDERDGLDECIIPSDCETNGYILDDDISKVLAEFHSNTKVVCIFDCCHSATICDVKYSWEGQFKRRIENLNSNIKAKVITISGCLDDQTSSDAYIADQSKYAGALTNTLLSILKLNNELNNDIFELVDILRIALKQQGYEQVPKLCSTYNLTFDKEFIM